MTELEGWKIVSDKDGKYYGRGLLLVDGAEGWVLTDDNKMFGGFETLKKYLSKIMDCYHKHEKSGFSTHCCEIRNVCEISKIDIAGMSGDKVKSISGRVIFNDRDQICFRLTIDKGLRKCFIRDVQLFDENKKSFVDEIVKAKKSTGFCCSTLTKGE